MTKISTDTIISQYQSGVESYTKFTKEVGLWASEKYVFEKHLVHSDHILDLGCGTGRTTFPIFHLGYQNIIGVDLTPEMVEKANELNGHFRTTLHFEVGDATNLNFPDLNFDAVIFSFNGLMSIPGAANRNLAVKEVNRVLKPGGKFIFTTHDRNREPAFFEFWKTERKKWNSGKQNPDLFEFGDIIANSKNEEREIFIHIPDEAEIIKLVTSSGLAVVETFYRPDKFEESEAVKLKSGECRFWVTRKKLNVDL